MQEHGPYWGKQTRKVTAPHCPIRGWRPARPLLCPYIYVCTGAAVPGRPGWEGRSRVVGGARGVRYPTPIERLITTGGEGEFPVSVGNVNPPVHKCGSSHKPEGAPVDSGVNLREKPLYLSFVRHQGLD